MSDTPVSSDETTLAGYMHLAAIILGFLSPLFVFVTKKESVFLQANAKSALNYTLSLLAAMVVLNILFVILGSVPIFGWVIHFFGGLLFLGIFIVHALFCFRAYQQADKGEIGIYPITFPLIK